DGLTRGQRLRKGALEQDLREHRLGRDPDALADENEAGGRGEQGGDAMWGAKRLPRAVQRRESWEEGGPRSRRWRLTLLPLPFRQAGKGVCGREHDPEKWVPVFGQDHAPSIRHD